MKTRQAFYLHTTKLTRIARRLCREILRPWRAARHPYTPINGAAIKAECECARGGRGGVLPAGARTDPGALPQARLGCRKPPRARWC